MQRHGYGTATPSSKMDGGASDEAAVSFAVIAVCLIVPWAIFTVNLTLLSFSMHYSHPHLSWFVVELNGCLVALSGVRAFYLFTRRSREQKNADNLDPSTPAPPLRRREWLHIFFFVTLFVAWSLGVACGLANYALHMRHFYGVTSLATYRNVDPAKANGQQLLDAGRIIFTKESHLDLERASTFTSSEVYCVAPVASGSQGQRLATYDFWAVGTNCCQGKGDFKCGHALNPLAHAGTRLLDEDQATNYRLAVQQAEAMYGLRAGQPLFLLWEEDPINEMSQRQDQGLKYFLIAAFWHFGMQLLFVVLVAGSTRLQNMMLLK